MTPARVLAIIGSGETAPTMTTVHGELLARALPGSRAVMLDTPYGFQENADEIAARSVAYFRDNVGATIEVASFRDAETATPVEYEQMCGRLAEAGWVFAGPGSPTYAIRQWRDTRVPELLGEKLVSGGVVVFSSAAAVGLGELAIPVYEIYKVGEPPRWIPGLDLLRGAGLRAAVVPHYNNAEGGTHDTRFCYLGERRLRVMERQLPDGCHVLGVDEHTACIIDLDAGTLSVRGRGRVTWRCDGAERHWQSGETVALEDVRSGGGREPAAPKQPVDVEEAAVASVGTATSPLMDETGRLRAAAAAAMLARDAGAATQAILALEAALHEWSQDTLESDEPDRARAVLRELIVRLADLAREGTADPRERIAPVVDAVVTLRDDARGARRFGDADRLRDALLAAGIALHDTPAGSTWELSG